jgi:hypothetical protein
MADVDRNFNNSAPTEKIPKKHQTIHTTATVGKFYKSLP